MKQKKTTMALMPQKYKTIKPRFNFSRQIVYPCILLLCVLFTACKKNSTDGGPKNPPNAFPAFSNKVILDWNKTTFDALESPNYLNTLTAARLSAMVHIAQYDALNSIVPVYEKYSDILSDTGAHPVAAAAVAAHTVLLHHVPEKRAMLDIQLANAIDTIANATAKQKGITLGLHSGNAIIALRATDGAFQNPIGAIAPSTVPGVYQAVPPFDFVFAPFWKIMEPFGLQTPQQFRSVPHVAITSAAYEKDFTEVKTFGDKNSTVRTADQTFYAKFWYEYSEIGWNRIAWVAANTEQKDLLTTARLFAMLNMALVDSYTAGWDAKFHYDFWRPYTAIRSAANDGNPQTISDTAWETLMPTPPVQDYPSTHSVLGNAGATVLTYFFGNNYEFATMSTSSPTPDATRTFKSFLKAADENADSRVMAGLHFRFSCTAGQEMGNKIGKWMIENTLKIIR
jgi:hypothetical protein